MKLRNYCQHIFTYEDPVYHELDSSCTVFKGYNIKRCTICGFLDNSNRYHKPPRTKSVGMSA